MFPRRQFAALLFASIAFSIPRASGQQSTIPSRVAETVMIHGALWTGEPYLVPGKPSPPSQMAQAIAIANGSILAVGSDAEIKPYIGPQTDVIDLAGRFAMPGFVDDHTHFLTGGFQLIQVQLRDSRDEADFAERIGRRAQTLGPGKWIEGGRWNAAKWPDEKMPTRWLIDSVTPQNPVFVNSWDGHQVLVNSLALKLAGITEETPDPPGGVIVRDPLTHQHTGLLRDTAMNLVAKVMPARSEEEIEAALRRGLEEASRNGVTSLADMNLGEHSPSGGINYARTPIEKELRLLHRAETEGWLTCRFYEILPVLEMHRLEDLGVTHGTGDTFIQLGAVKAFADGSLESSTAWMYSGFADQPANTGVPNPLMSPPAKMAALVREANVSGIQFITHAIGDRAVAEMLDVYSGSAANPADYRMRLEHDEVVRPSDFARFAKLGVIASMQPAIDGGSGVTRRIGTDRIGRSYAWRSMLDAGAVLAFGSDWPVVGLNPLMGIHSAVTRQDLQDNPPGGWVPEQRVTLNEALRAYTQGSAYAAFQERDKGSLAPGRLADIVVLSKDLTRIAPSEVKGVTVEMTIVGGRVVYDANSHARTR
jgi:hypothetical protein